MNQRDIEKKILIWLSAGLILVSITVVIGGITRLTQSGLSMVDWNLFMGAVPPIGEAEWTTTFEEYQKYPEYQLKNSSMTLEEFKGIFFWEYIHRQMGRLIGLVFIIPFVFFLIKKWLSPKLLRQSLILLALGSFQAFLGWIMVKSGLKDMPHVSHYKLALHLSAAFTTFAYIWWVIFGIRYKNKSKLILPKMRRLIVVFFVILGFQIIYGAFVAGLDAGLLYPTWPKMGSEWIAAEVGNSYQADGFSSLHNNRASIQFVHRCAAILVGLMAISIWFIGRKRDLSIHQNRGIFLILVFTCVQFILGVITLIYQVPITMGVLHQFGALILVACTTYTLYQFRR